MSSEYVIEVEDLAKVYQIYDTPRERLKQFFVPRLRRLFRLPLLRYYKEFQALGGVSFKVKKGETVGIIGRNGSGKSTLLQIICGTLTPSGGHARTFGRVAALLELGSGFNPEFTGRENVFLNAAVLGLSQSEIERRYPAIVKFADIGSFIDQPIKTYSSGMVVRLAFATAIHVDPDILVVDEALAVGDTAFQQKCLNRIRQMQKSGVSILLVTHSSNTLVEYCDRGLFFKRGRLIMDSICRDVVKAYANDLVEDEGGITVGRPEITAQVSMDDTGNEGFIERANSGTPPLYVESVQCIDQVGNVVASVRHGEEMFIQITVRSERDIAEPCFGIQLSSVDGIVLWGVTTQAMGLDMSEMRRGVHVFKWCIDANFSGNRYILAIGVGEILNGEYRRHHRLDYAGHFDVVPIPHSGFGWLAPDPKFIPPVLCAALELGVDEA